MQNASRSIAAQVTGEANPVRMPLKFCMRVYELSERESEGKPVPHKKLGSADDGSHLG